jgi:hypothetical protein
MWQRSATAGDSGDGYWSLACSASAGFTGGSADVAATADDEQFVRTNYQWFKQGGTPNITHVGVHDAPSDAGEYGWIVVDVSGTTDTVFGVAFADALDEVPDDEMFALAIGGRTGSLTLTGLRDTDCFTWSNYDDADGQVWALASYAAPRNALGYYVTYAGISDHDASEHALRIPVGGMDGGGYMGISDWLVYPGVVRAYPHTGDGKTLLHIGTPMIDKLWDGVSTPQ